MEVVWLALQAINSHSSSPMLDTISFNKFVETTKRDSWSSSSQTGGTSALENTVLIHYTTNLPTAWISEKLPQEDFEEVTSPILGERTTMTPTNVNRLCTSNSNASLPQNGKNLKGELAAN